MLAPITGTIIEKTVERGQVISSPTSDVGGGTVLLKMADLNLVQVRTLVDETDIGKIQAGQRATVTVDAYPNRPFEGTVLKIEPQAETEQNVTMFPVLVRIENRNGLLRPGMNAEVEIHVGRARQRARGAQRGAPHPARRGLRGAACWDSIRRTRCSSELARAGARPRSSAAHAGHRRGSATRRRASQRGDACRRSGRRHAAGRAAAPGRRCADGLFGGRYIVFVKRAATRCRSGSAPASPTWTTARW